MFLLDFQYPLPDARLPLHKAAINQIFKSSNYIIVMYRIKVKLSPCSVPLQPPPYQVALFKFSLAEIFKQDNVFFFHFFQQQKNDNQA